MSIAPNAPAERTEDTIKAALAESPLGEAFNSNPSPVTHFMAVELAFVWQEFQERLSKIPLIQALENGTITLEDYKFWLINIRQQVIDGGRWIALAASSMEDEYFTVRSSLIGHAKEEHKDFILLEKNYVACGGDIKDIQTCPKNIGSEAFSAFMFERARQKNPLDLFGAMFIIEGLGAGKAPGWVEAAKTTLKLEKKQISFLDHHAEHDDEHLNKLRMILSMPNIDQKLADRVVKTAKVVARLYALQLEELGNH